MAASTETDHPPPDTPLARTPLHALHLALGARMVAFAGYEMPVQYPTGILAEHNHTRRSAGLFDVSHMGQAFLLGGRHEVTAQALEAFCPADILGLDPGRQRYSQLLSADGTILDDFMVTRPIDPGEDGALMLVVNAATKARILPISRPGLPAMSGCCVPITGRFSPCKGRALPKFCRGIVRRAKGSPSCRRRRRGSTGSPATFRVPAIRARTALKSRSARIAWNASPAPSSPSRKSSRSVSARGICSGSKPGSVSTATTSTRRRRPVEAGLTWSIGKRRRAEGGFPGADRVRLEIANSPARRRVGLILEGKVPAREGADIKTPEDILVGRVTSGGFSPTLGRPIAMGYVETSSAAIGTPLDLVVRGKPMAAHVVALPFVPHRYHKESQSPLA